MASNRGRSEPGPVLGAGGSKEDHGGSPSPPPPLPPSPRHPRPLPPPPPPPSPQGGPARLEWPPQLPRRPSGPEPAAAEGGEEDHGGAPAPPPPPPPSPQGVPARPEWPPQLPRRPSAGPEPAAAGGGEEDHGGAPAPPPPGILSSSLAISPSTPPPQLAAPPESPHQAAAESGLRTPLKALRLVRKTLSRPIHKRVLPEDHGIIISPKAKVSNEQHPELLKPWTSTSNEKEARAEVSSCGAENDRDHAIVTKKNNKGQHRELLKPWRISSIEQEARMEVSPSGAENDRNHDVPTKMVDCGCSPMAAYTKFACAIGNRRADWGRNFELKFGNKSTSNHKRSAEVTINGSGSGADNDAMKHQNKGIEDYLTVVVSTIHDLIAFDPDTTIVEFDGNIEGKELGRLFRIAKVLKFRRFVHNDALVRARLHYTCSNYDGERRGRNLDAEAKELLCSKKDKKK